MDQLCHIRKILIDYSTKRPSSVFQMIQEYRDNLLKIAGVDTVADVIEYLTETGDKSASDIAGDYVLDAAREKALEGLVEGASGEAGRIIDTVVISSDQYEKDKEKWKNRAASAIAKRMVNDFYDGVEEKLYNINSIRFRGWELKIDDIAYRRFSWNGSEDNIETCNVWMCLKKADNKLKDASGVYSGIVHIVFEYDMSGYDASLKNDYLAVYFDNMVLSEVSDGGKPTTISRELDDSSFSINLQVPVQKGSVTTHQLDVSRFSDIKSISINREITLTAKGSMAGYSSDYHYVVTYSADSDKEILVQEVLSGNVSISSKTDEVYNTYNSTLTFDQSIWNSWKSSKDLSVLYP